MRTKTITGTVTMPIVLGQGRYGSRLTIADTGAVLATAPGATAITAPDDLARARILNQGTVAGGAGASGDIGGTGGIGIDLAAAAVVTNQGVVTGGDGGYGYYGGGAGGIGIVFDSSGKLFNTGVVHGGGGDSTYNIFAQAGAGGIGVQLASGVVATNDGSVSGGAGGYCANQDNGPYGYSGDGGVGVLISADSILDNHGTILGGGGGQYAPFGNDGFYYGNGGAGGDGVLVVDGGSLSNTGIIAGGAGGGSFYHQAAGGLGVDLSHGGTAVNSGSIEGGAGGDVSYANSGAGGAGVSLDGGAVLTNSGNIAGGAGGYSVFGHGGAGGAGVQLSDATLTNAGTISGGAGGNGGYGAGAAGDAVQFGAVAATLIADPGAVFQGAVAANANVNDTLELAGRHAGTLTGFGTAISGFTTITEDAGAHWKLTGSISGTGALQIGTGATLILGGAVSIARIAFGAGGGETMHLNDPLALTSHLSGFSTGDTIGLATLQATSFRYQSGVLTLLDAGQNVIDTLAFDGHYSEADFALKPDAGGTDVVYAGQDATGAGSAYHTIEARVAEGLWAAGFMPSHGLA